MIKLLKNPKKYEEVQIVQCTIKFIMCFSLLIRNSYFDFILKSGTGDRTEKDMENRGFITDDR